MRCQSRCVQIIHFCYWGCEDENGNKRPLRNIQLRSPFPPPKMSVWPLSPAARRVIAAPTLPKCVTVPNAPPRTASLAVEEMKLSRWTILLKRSEKSVRPCRQRNLNNSRIGAGTANGCPKLMVKRIKLHPRRRIAPAPEQ